MEDTDLQQIQQMIKDEIKKASQQARFDVVPIPAHTHNGVDSGMVDSTVITNLNVPKIARVFSTTSTGNWATGSAAVQNTFIPNANMIDLFDVASATGPVTFSPPVGSPVNGQILGIRLTSSNAATARAITWSSATGGYLANSGVLPSTTTTGETLITFYQYDTNNSTNKWRLISSPILSGSHISTISGTAIVPRVITTTSTATPTPNADTTDLFSINAQTVTAAFQTPSGTPVDGQKIRIRITSSNAATARALTWSTGYLGNSPALPSATTTAKATDLGFQYDTSNSVNVFRLIDSANS